MSTYDFSTPYTSLPHNLIKEKLIELIEHYFNREGSLNLACNEKHAFYLRHFSESRSSSGSTLCVRLSVRLSVHPSVRNTFGVPSLCNP